MTRKDGTMQNESYLLWLSKKTNTVWWVDSGDPDEISRALESGCKGITTNPMHINTAVEACRLRYREEIKSILDGKHDPNTQAADLSKLIVTKAAKQVEKIYRSGNALKGYVCAQINPYHAGQREEMLRAAREFHAWAPNIAVKLPVTQAGLDVLEECISIGITVTATVSFTVSQVLAAAERHRKGSDRARKNGVEPGRCFAVIMLARTNDFLREVAQDSRAGLRERDLDCAGVAVVKRAYSIFKARNYEAVLLIGSFKESFQVCELAGADLILTINPAFQNRLLSLKLPLENRIDAPVPEESLARLLELPDFRRAYEPGGLDPEEFIKYAATQRCLTDFRDRGWDRLTGFKL